MYQPVSQGPNFLRGCSVKLANVVSYDISSLHWCLASCLALLPLTVQWIYSIKRAICSIITICVHTEQSSSTVIQGFYPHHKFDEVVVASLPKSILLFLVMIVAAVSSCFHLHWFVHLLLFDCCNHHRHHLLQSINWDQIPKVYECSLHNPILRHWTMANHDCLSTTMKGKKQIHFFLAHLYSQAANAWLQILMGPSTNLHCVINHNMGIYTWTWTKQTIEIEHSSALHYTLAVWHFFL